MADNIPFGNTLESVNTKIGDVRKELDAKIENRISNPVFFGIFGTFVIIVGGILLYVTNQNNIMSAKMDNVRDRITVIETTIRLRNRQ